MELAWVDLVLVLLMLTSLCVGLWRGFTYELLSLAGWVVAYFGCTQLAPLIAEWLPVQAQERLGPAAQQLGSTVAAFVIILVVWGIAARLVRLLIQATPLSFIDRVLGAGFGLVRGVLVCLLLVLVVSMTPASSSPTWRASRAVPWIEAVLSDLHVTLPESASKLIPA